MLPWASEAMADMLVDRIKSAPRHLSPQVIEDFTAGPVRWEAMRPNRASFHGSETLRWQRPARLGSPERPVRRAAKPRGRRQRSWRGAYPMADRRVGAA